MFTDHQISIEEHTLWLKELERDPSRQVFLVLGKNSDVLGLVSLVDINSNFKEATWAFYLDKKIKGGLGPTLEYSLINYAFNKMNLERLKCRVLDNNPSVLKLHKKFSFLVEKFNEMQFHRNYRWLGVYFLSLDRKIWGERRASIYSKYRKIFDNFDVNFSV